MLEVYQLILYCTLGKGNKIFILQCKMLFTGKLKFNNYKLLFSFSTSEYKGLQMHLES